MAMSKDEHDYAAVSRRDLGRWLLALTVVGLPARVGADPALQVYVEQSLRAVVAKNGLPGAAVMVMVGGTLAASAAHGLRATGKPQPVTVADRWAIGSDTKAFTATMIARLAEREGLSLEAPLPIWLPALATGIDPAFNTVTMRQLLSHTAGLAPLTDDADLPAFKALFAGINNVSEQRLAVARAYLKRPPATPPGRFAYSNIGYIIAGAIAEQRSGKSWEALIRQEIFKPLGIMRGGFGPPGRGRMLSAPWGHREVNGALVPLAPSDPEASDPPVIGPTGTISLTLADWMRFASDQLAGVHGRGQLLERESYKQLHTPVADDYALGWGVRLGADGVPILLTHSGSNGHWLADIRIMPRRDIITLFVTNAGNEAANQAVFDFGKPLFDRLKPFD